MKRILLLLVFLSLSLPLYSSDKASIKVGISCDLSDRYGEVGKAYLAGWQTYFKKINKERGGLDGKKIIWKVLDDRSNPERAVKNTEELLAWGADVLAGYVGPDCTSSVVDYIEENKKEINLFFPLNGGKFIKENLRNRLYSIDPLFSDESDLLFSYFVTEQRSDNWGIVYDDSYSAQYVKQVLEERLSEYALRPILVDINNDMAVTQLIEFWPDVIVVVLDPDSTYNFVKRLVDNIDAKKMPSVVIVSSAFSCENIRKISDVMPPGKFFFVQTTPYPQDRDYPLIREYLDALKKYTSETKPCFISLHGYIAAKIMCNILAKSGDTSVYSVSQIAESIDNDVGIGKDIRFTSVIHRIPIGVGLFQIIGKSPEIREVLWESFSHRNCDVGKEFRQGIEKRPKKSIVSSVGKETKPTNSGDSLDQSSEASSVSVEIKDVAPAN